MIDGDARSSSAGSSSAGTPDRSSAERGSLWRRIRRRCIGGAVALLILALVVYLDGGDRRPWCAISLATVLGLLSAFELGRMFSRRSPAFPTAWLVVCTAAVVGLKIAAYAGEGEPLWWTLAAFVAVAMVFLVREVARGDAETGVDVAATAILSMSCILLFSFVLDILLGLPAPSGIRACIYVILVSKSNDIGGYLIGNAVGGPKLAPKVSPGKTRSGSVGGLLLGVVVAFALAHWAGFQPGVWWTLAFAISVGMANQLGDLSESLIKRACGVKDSGGYLPTFGGALDMIDSLVFAAPVGYWFGVVQGGFAPV